MCGTRYTVHGTNAMTTATAVMVARYGKSMSADLSQGGTGNPEHDVKPDAKRRQKEGDSHDCGHENSVMNKVHAESLRYGHRKPAGS